MLVNVVALLVVGATPMYFDDIYYPVFFLIKIRRVPTDDIIRSIKEGVLAGLVTRTTEGRPLADAEYRAVTCERLRGASLYMTNIRPGSAALLDAALADAWTEYAFLPGIGPEFHAAIAHYNAQ